MNHSQIAPVQQLDSGCWCLPGAGTRPGWARLWGDEGHCSLWQESRQGSWPDHWPLLFPQPAAPRLPHHRTEFTHCYLAVLSPWRPGGGAEATPPDLATPTPCYLASSRPLQPLQTFPSSFSQHPLGLALSAVVFFFPASPCLSSLSRALRGGIPRPNTSVGACHPVPTRD